MCVGFYPGWVVASDGFEEGSDFNFFSIFQSRWDDELTGRIDRWRASIAPVLFGEDVFKHCLESGLGLVGDVGVDVVDGGVTHRPVEAVDKVVESAEDIGFV